MGGVTINPVAGLAKPPEPGPSPVEQYANLLKLKQMGQAGVLQQQQGQINQEQLKQQQIQTQQAEQQQKDQEAFRTAMSDPSMKGKTIGDIADTLAQSGNISQTAWQAAKKADTEHRKDLAEADEKTLKNRKEAHDATQNLYNNAMQMPDDQLQANWPQIAQQYNSIPGNEKMPLDPNKPLPKQALAQFAPMIDMGNAYFDQELARREKVAELAGKQATTQKTQMEVAQGGSTDSARFTTDYLKANSLENTPANRLKAFKEFTKETKVDPGVARINVLGSFGMEVADPNNPGQTIIVPRNQAAGMTGKSSASVTVPRKEAEYMTSGKGGGQLTAFNTAMGHLDVLDKLAADLHNTDIRVANRAKQAWADQTGNPAPANFAAAVNAMSGEVASALKASGATDQEIEKAASTFDRAESPAQLKGAIETYRTLLRGKRDNLKQQHEAAQQGKPNFGQDVIYARDPQGKLHSAPAGTALPAGWTQEKR